MYVFVEGFRFQEHSGLLDTLFNDRAVIMPEIAQIYMYDMIASLADQKTCSSENARICHGFQFAEVTGV